MYKALAPEHCHKAALLRGIPQKKITFNVCPLVVVNNTCRANFQMAFRINPWQRQPVLIKKIWKMTDNLLNWRKTFLIDHVYWSALFVGVFKFARILLLYLVIAIQQIGFLSLTMTMFISLSSFCRNDLDTWFPEDTAFVPGTFVCVWSL